MNDYMSKWQPVADDVLSVLMVNPRRWMETFEHGITSLDLPPGNWPVVYRTVIELAAAQKIPSPLLDTAIATRAGADVSVEWVTERIAAFDEWREGGFATQLAALKKFGRGHRQLMELRQGEIKLKAALNNGLETDNVAQEVLSGLQAEQMSNEKIVSLGDLLDANKTEMNNDPVPVVKSGLWLLDNWTGGLTPNEFMAWVAPYKSRKTSVMANALLAALKRGDQVNLFTFDERRADFIYRLEAMLLAEYMWQNEAWDHPLNGISSKIIRGAGKNWRKWDGVLQKAFEYAFDTLSVYGRQCRIYDAATCNATTKSISALCHVDKIRYGLDMVFVDHLQSLAGYKTIFEQVEQGSSDLHLMRGELDCRLWVLSQQNEAAIKGNDEGDWSPNVKGGGGLASKADTVLVSKYRQGTITDARALRVEVRLARNEENGVYGYMEVHPASGWITPREDVVKHYNLNDVLNEKIGAPQ